MGKRIRLCEKDVINKSLPEFYDAVGAYLNVDTATVHYDCRKILISKTIQDHIKCSYHKLYPELSEKDPVDLKARVTQMLLVSGPKVSHELQGLEVEILEGFIES